MDPGRTVLRPGNFLSPSGKALLQGCEAAIFQDWQQNFKKDKSLANILKRTLLADLESAAGLVDSAVSVSYRFKRAFHHRSSTSDLLVEIFGEFHEGTPDFMVVTQSKAFKEKFLYDAATMTIDTLAADLPEFVRKLRLTNTPRLLFLVMSDLSFLTSVWQHGKNKYIKLEHDQHP
jgi:hypothetical protein